MTRFERGYFDVCKRLGPPSCATNFSFLAVFIQFAVN